MIEARPLHPSHQFRGPQLVRPGKSIDCAQCRTLYAAFNGTQLCSIYSELDVYVELRKPRFISYLAQHTSEGLFGT
jgi:hypothetical protein